MYGADVTAVPALKSGTCVYLRVEDKVLGSAHVLVVRVWLNMDPSGVGPVVSVHRCGGDVGSGEVHLL